MFHSCGWKTKYMHAEMQRRQGRTETPRSQSELQREMKMFITRGQDIKHAVGLQVFLPQSFRVGSLVRGKGTWRVLMVLLHTPGTSP